MAKDPEVQVSARVEVRLRADVVSHALRCHLSHVLVPQGLTPAVKGPLSSVTVAIDVDQDGTVFGATLVYEPDLPPTSAPTT